MSPAFSRNARKKSRGDSKKRHPRASNVNDSSHLSCALSLRARSPRQPERITAASRCRAPGQAARARRQSTQGRTQRRPPRCRALPAPQPSCPRVPPTASAPKKNPGQIGCPIQCSHLAQDGAAMGPLLASPNAAVPRFSTPPAPWRVLPLFFQALNIYP